MIKELRVVNQYYYYESPIYILRNDKVKNILSYGDNSPISYSLFVTDNDGNLTGEIENLKMFEVKEFT